MEIKNKINIHNRFDIEVRDKNTGELKQKAVAYNIVLSQMYTRLCSGLSYFANIHFGSGTGTLSAARTSLFSHLGTKAAADEQIIKAIPLSTWKRKIVLNPEEYVGNTISEVGIAFGATNTNLVTHSLLKDSEGNPISIVKTDTDVITIYATVFVTFNNSNPNLRYVGVPSSNALVNYLVGGAVAPTGSFGLMEMLYSNDRLGSTSNVTWTADTVNKQRKTNVLRFDTTVGNGQVKALDFTSVFAIQFPQDSVFTGQNYQGVNVGLGDGVRLEWKLSSLNIKQDSLIVKVNGVQNNAFAKKVLRDYLSKYVNPVNTPPGNVNGVASNAIGNIMAVAHNSSPFVTTYDLIESLWVKRPNPVDLPAGTGLGVALSLDGNIMAVAHTSSPFVTTYDWISNAWVKRPNPVNLPTGNGAGVTLSPDGSIMAVAHASSPFVTTYDWISNAWVKRSNPVNLPNSDGFGVALSLDGNIMAVSHTSSPFVTTYDWISNAWVKRPNPVNLPSGTGRMVSLSSNGSIMAVANSAVSPYITTYNWTGSAWVKRALPASPPPNEALGVALSTDGSIMAVAHLSSPFVSVYDWINNAWLKRQNPVNLPGNTALCVALSQDGNIMTGNQTASPYLTIYMTLPSTSIVFDTPPAIGDVITADYTVDGVHKTDQYVIDASFAIQFGEGV